MNVGPTLPVSVNRHLRPPSRQHFYNLLHTESSVFTPDIMIVVITVTCCFNILRIVSYICL